MKPTKKKPLRRTEVFFCNDDPLLPKPYCGWKPIKFNKLKKGDIFRCFDTQDDGTEKPDQVVRGQHVVCVALEDTKPRPMPELGVVQCLPLRGFHQRRK